MTGNAEVGARIRTLREQRGLTQQGLVEEIAVLAWARNGIRVGLNPDMVSKWERGEKTPSHIYRELLAGALGADVPELMEGRRPHGDGL
jgi:transcriptional regulator with XRE-family HTH domain